MSTNITATVTRSCSISGTTFQSGSEEVAAESLLAYEKTIAAAATDTASGITFPKAKLLLLYLLSDSSDCEVVFTNSGGNTTINLVAGVPYLWTGANGDNPLAQDATTMTVENNGDQAVSTDVHARVLLETPNPDSSRTKLTTHL